MTIVLVLLGGLIAFAGLVVVTTPDVVFAYIDRHAGKPSLYALAVIVRLVLGIALLGFANQSAFPTALQVIGWISMTAAVFLLAIGRKRFERLIRWAVRFATPCGRPAGAAALLLGAFIVYAVVRGTWA